MGVGIKHWYGEKNKKRSRFGSIPAVWHVPLLVHIHYDSAEGACNIHGLGLISTENPGGRCNHS